MQQRFKNTEDVSAPILQFQNTEAVSAPILQLPEDVQLSILQRVSPVMRNGLFAVNQTCQRWYRYVKQKKALTRLPVSYDYQYGELTGYIAEPAATVGLSAQGSLLAVSVPSNQLLPISLYSLSRFAKLPEHLSVWDHSPHHPGIERAYVALHFRHNDTQLLAFRHERITPVEHGHVQFVTIVDVWDVSNGGLLRCHELTRSLNPNLILSPMRDGGVLLCHQTASGWVIQAFAANFDTSLRYAILDAIQQPVSLTLSDDQLCLAIECRVEPFSVVIIAFDPIAQRLIPMMTLQDIKPSTFCFMPDNRQCMVTYNNNLSAVALHERDNPVVLRQAQVAYEGFSAEIDSVTLDKHNNRFVVKGHPQNLNVTQFYIGEIGNFGQCLWQMRPYGVSQETDNSVHALNYQVVANKLVYRTTGGCTRYRFFPLGTTPEESAKKRVNRQAARKELQQNLKFQCK